MHARTKASASATGPDQSTPSTPINRVRISMAGRMNRSCFDIEVIAALTGFPIAWKKTPAHACTPFKKVSSRYIRKHFTPNSS